jgi:putative lipoprotein
MKFAVVLVLGAFQFGAPQERTRADDRWFARDKALHFVVSAAIQSAGHSALRGGGLDYREASTAAGAITLSVGVGKELWDRSQGRYFSWKDLTADTFGGGSAAVLVRQIDR